MKKKLLLSLLFLFIFVNHVFAYYIYLTTSRSFYFPNVTPQSEWIEGASDQITDPVWKNAANFNFTIAARDITGKNQVRIFMEYKNDYRELMSSLNKTDIANAVDTSMNAKIGSGLVGLINFNTINVNNNFDSYLPIRFKTGEPYAIDWLGIWHFTANWPNLETYASQGKSENDAWLWMQDRSNSSAQYFNYNYATLWTLKNALGVLEWGIPPLCGYWTRYLPVSVKIAVPKGSKKYGTYLGTIHIEISAQ